MISRTIMTLLISVLTFNAAGVERSFEHAGYLKFRVDPQVPVFAPQNIGLHMFSRNSGGGEMPYDLEELKVDGFVIELDNDQYDLKPVGESGSRSAEYWTKLRNVLSGAPEGGIIFDCRVSDLLLGKLSDEELRRDFVSSFTALCAEVPWPILSFTSPDSQVAGQVRDEIRRSIPALPVFGIFESIAPTRESVAGWDCVAVSPGSAPASYKGQAAVSYFRSVAPGTVIFFVMEKPDFLAETFWLVTGVAGLYHKSPKVEKENEEWRHLRALATFRTLIAPGQTSLLPTLSGGKVLGAFGDEASGYYMVLEPGAFTARIQSHPDQPTYLESWYDPQNDLKIVASRGYVAADGIYRLRTPDERLWLYGHRSLGPILDNETTTPAVVIDPDFDIAEEQ